MRNQIGHCFILKHKITLYYLLPFVFIHFITICHSLSLMVIFVTRYHSLSLVVIHCHSLSPAVIYCHSLYHSLSLVVPLVVIRCHFFFVLFFIYSWCWIFTIVILYRLQQAKTNRLHLASYSVGGNQKAKQKKFFVIKIVIITMR